MTCRLACATRTTGSSRTASGSIVFNRETFLRGNDPHDLFAALDAPDPSHAFYLGRELERAALAVRLGKKYTQESPLRWGYLSDARDEAEPS